MFNKFSFAVGALFAVFVTACSSNDAGDIAGGTIDPNTVAENNSSSDAADIESSNSADVVLSSSEKKVLSSSSSRDANDGSHTIRIESSSSGRSAIESSSSCKDCGNGIDPIDISSSSSELRDGGIARTNDFSIRCVDARDVREQASAYKSVAGDVVVFALQNVQFDIPCDAAERDEYIEFLNTEKPFPIGHEGDTLFVRPFLAEGIDYACSCAASASFSLDKNYFGIGYTAFGRQDSIPVQEN